MNPLLVVLPYCQKDVAQAKELLTWIAELTDESHTRNCAVLLVADSAVPIDTCKELKSIAERGFAHNETIAVKVPEARQNWPMAPNAMFHDASKQIIECYKMPWLWLEPDAVPLKSDWLLSLEVAYHDSPKLYMGVFVESAQPNLPPVHMAGVGIYPSHAHAALRQFCAGEDAWDMAMAHYVVPRASRTNLIQSLWGEPNLPPVFVEAKQGQPNEVTLDVLQPGSVLFHRTKTSELIRLLRARKTSNPEYTPIPRKRGRPRKLTLSPEAHAHD
jgi:hypothetical protein